MKKIAVICAMEDEAKDIVDRLSLEKTGDTVSGAPVFEGTSDSNKIIVTVCRVGKVAAAMISEEIITLFSPDMIINLGIAGGVFPGIKTGDICISEGFVQYDYDLSPLGIKRGELDELGFSVIKSDPSISEKLLDISKKVYSEKNCYFGIIATGDSFVSSSETAKMLYDDFHAFACDMEGAAIAFVCYFHNIPFTAVRAISDNANEKSAYDFNSFRRQAVKNSTEIIFRFVKNIN